MDPSSDADASLVPVSKHSPPSSSSPHALWSAISTSGLVKFLLLFASGWAIILVLNYFQEVIVTFAIASILSLILSYPARYLERHLGRNIALGITIALSLITVLTTAGFIALAVVGQLQQLLTSISNSLQDVPAFLERLELFLSNRNINADLNIWLERLSAPLGAIVGGLVQSASSLPILLVRSIIVLVIAFFLLIDDGQLWQFVLKVVPGQQRDRFSQSVRKGFVGFLRGQVIISALLGVVSFGIYWLLQIPFPLALAAIVAILDLIPGIGATLGVIAITLIGLVNSGWLVALKIVIASITLQQIQDNLVAPRVMQEAVNLSPVVVFLALLIGERVAGFWGLFLAVPAAGTLVTFLNLEELQGH